jgi:hypothetical protein
MKAAAGRAGIAALVVVLAATGAIIGLRAWVMSIDKPSAGESCTLGAFALDPTQASVAATMVAVVTTRALPERAAVLTIAGALQESKLRNIPSGQGDRDSVGVLQQRPSQGWGSIAQLSDLRYATGAFLDALVKVNGWQTLPLADAIQEVQRSADGALYAQHEPEAQAIADVFTGAQPAGIACTFPAPTQTAAPQAVATKLRADLPVNPPAVGGNTVRVPAASWATTAWFVAYAEQLGIDSVSYAQRTWARSKGWHTDPNASSDTVVATMRNSQ